MRRSHLAANVMLVAAIVAGAYFLRNFLAIGALAILTVIVFNPVYSRLVKALRGRAKTATALTVLTAVVIVVIPLVLVAILSYFQALTFFADAQKAHLTSPDRLYGLVRDSIEGFNRLAARLPEGQSLQFSADAAISTLQGAVPAIGNAALAFLRDGAGSLFNFFTGLILYVVLLVYLFLHQRPLVAWVKRISPLADSINERYLSHMAVVGRSMVFGTFIVGAVQGVLGAIFLTIAGVPYPVFWAVILTVLSFIPVGGGILTVPIGIIQLLLGNIWQGLFILATHFLVVTTIDNLLRALLVSKEAQLPPVLTLFAAFAGLQFFGPLGVIYGPILMVVIMTTIQIYNDYAEAGIPLKAKTS